MLLRLGIRDVVLIDRLDLDFGSGLSVLTGETGAGKSILLDALGLALGARADSGLVRAGATQAVVTAAFEIPDTHPAWALLAENGLEREDELILRRTLSADGRSRATVNDQAISVGLLRQLGALLVEIQGQFDGHALMDSGTHRGILDAYGDLTSLVTASRATWREWAGVREAKRVAAEQLARVKAQEEYLRHVVGELDKLDPQEGEESELSATRARLQSREKLLGTLNNALSALAEEDGAEAKVASATRLLSRAGSDAGDLDPILASLDRASSELADATETLARLLRDDGYSEGQLERLEDRLFALRAAARKHQVTGDELPALYQRLKEELAAVDNGEAGLKKLEASEAETRKAYLAAAEALSSARKASVLKLDAAVMAELPPLKLDRARFTTQVAKLPDNNWGPDGIDDVAFLIATNPGSNPGPLGKIASGGELSRFLLALKVVLAGVAPVPTLVFDEVDSGIGGATAAAVGERLARLGKDLQLLVITHSPQVAALGDAHLNVVKSTAEAGVSTTVLQLTTDQRREEIARMLSGSSITDEARAAASKLISRIA
ncbi:DNA repair protein RecN [Lacibacterium aquatile]|uniref:DNA repair protein RecN n=1 Tax=Lacibacterium aquatile TaxID=1168082 RepID=A0ABW5DT59_9PROT